MSTGGGSPELGMQRCEREAADARRWMSGGGRRRKKKLGDRKGIRFVRVKMAWWG